MTRPYGLLRAGFPYLRTIGEFTNTSWPLDIAFGKEGRLYTRYEVERKMTAEQIARAQELAREWKRKHPK